MDSNSLVLERFAYLPFATLGWLRLPGGSSFATLERPWLNNSPYVSCIPEGEYVLRYRNSPKITKITRGEFSGGWEFVDVKGRTYIMIHSGNWTHNSQGCVLIGEYFNDADNILKVDHEYMGTSRVHNVGVMNSEFSFSLFMSYLSKDKEYLCSVSSVKAI